MLSTITPKIRVLLLDRHELVREGLRLLIESRQDMIVVGETGDCDQALEIAIREQPDIILIDPNIGGDDIQQVLSDLLRAAKNSRIIMLMSVSTLRACQHTVCLGAMGLVLKEEASEALINAIESVHTGRVWAGAFIPREMAVGSASGARNRQDNPELSRIALLTHREREVIEVIAEGMKTKQIAETLFISEATVSHHLTSIYNKLGVSDRSQLIVYAYRQGLVALKF